MKKLVSIVLVTLLIPTLTQAAKPIYSGGKERAAVRGYDVVAYFTEDKPVKGQTDYAFEHEGAKWLFSTQENLQLFSTNPNKYMPQYGGYCAYAVSRNSTASSKPQYFTVHDNKLYLNYSASVYKKWLKDKDDYIESADENWPEILAK